MRKNIENFIYNIQCACIWEHAVMSHPKGRLELGLIYHLWLNKENGFLTSGWRRQVMGGDQEKCGKQVLSVRLITQIQAGAVITDNSH